MRHSPPRRSGRSAFDPASTGGEVNFDQQHFAIPDANGRGRLPLSARPPAEGHGRIDINDATHHSAGRIRQPLCFSAAALDGGCFARLLDP